ncbi:HAD family hydrolase [Mediterraneibacter sp.]|jgi:phosphoglycolate phosphatase|uniref:HAD family hydrolase n=1 Tax=Mediterraneibacter sp. TaxID=2316022 RepID=UPI0027B9ECE9|nr:HAD family hydrolase [Mediterraneibacter sp.]
MKYEMIFFDLDGTITDSALGIMNSIKYALEKNSLPMLSEEQLRSFIGPPLREQFCKVCGLTDAEGAKMVVDYREYYKDKGIFENRVYDGVMETLRNLKEKGYRLAVATSKPEIFARQIADYFGFSEYFELIGGACMDESRTDKYEVIEYVLDSCQIKERNRVVMIGDRSHDMIGAKRAGLHSIGVLYGYGSKEELEQSGAEVLAETPKEVISMLEG